MLNFAKIDWYFDIYPTVYIVDGVGYQTLVSPSLLGRICVYMKYIPFGKSRVIKKIISLNLN